MKKAYILLSIAVLALLATSCTGKAENTETPVTTETNNEEQATVEGTPTDAAELTGTVTGKIKNPHHLAGKTLIFDVEAVVINKADGNSAEEIESGDAIEVHYTGTLEDGEVFDSSRERNQTLPFTVGAGQMIAGFDAGVVGMKKGESKSITIAPKDAYGEEFIEQTIPKADLASFASAGFKLEVGEKLPTQIGEFEITAVSE